MSGCVCSTLGHLWVAYVTWGSSTTDGKMPSDLPVHYYCSRCGLHMVVGKEGK